MRGALTGADHTDTATDAELTRELLHAVRRPLPAAPYTVASISLKGGVGKTTVSAGLGLTLARHRADRVIAIDANLDAGTLADRLIDGEPKATVQHLLDDLLDDDMTLAAVADLDHYTHLAERLAVLPGHKDPSIGAAFAGDDYTELIGLLGRFWHIIVADCGTGLADEAMRAILDHTDTLVLVTTPTPDAASLAEATLDWLAREGYERLAEASVLVLCHHAQHTPANGLRTRFLHRCRAVIDIPADAHLAHDRMLSLDQLAAPTRQAYLHLAAAVLDAAPARSSSDVSS